MVNKMSYYQKNRLKICIYTLKPAERTIKKIRETYAAIVDSYYDKYPFDEYEKYVIYIMTNKGIFENKREYSDCLSVSSIAYMYSVSQCAYRGYKDKHVKA